MSSEEIPFPTIEVDLGEHGGPIRFTSAEELSKWIQEEVNAWRWARSHERNWNFPRTISNSDPVTPLFDRLGEIRNHLEALNASINKEETDDIAPRALAIEDTIKSLYVKDRIGLYSKERAGIYCLELSKRNEYLARFVVAALVSNAPLRVESDLAIRGEIYAEALRRGWNENTPCDDAANDAFLKNWTNRLQTREKELTQQIAEKEAKAIKLDNQIKESKQALDGFKHNSRGTLKSREQEFNAFTSKCDREWESLKELYEQYMKLKAPTTYWRKKRNEHAIGTGFFGIITILLLFYGTPYLSKLISTNLPISTPQNAIPWRMLWEALVFTSVGLWALRVFSKLFLSQFHLMTDARERELFITTYLALNEQNSSSTDKEGLQLVLTSIFRPSASGIISDERGPNLPLDSIAKKIKPGG